MKAVDVALAITRAEAKICQLFMKSVAVRPMPHSKLVSALIKVSADCTNQTCIANETWADKIWEPLAKLVQTTTEPLTFSSLRVWFSFCLVLLSVSRIVTRLSFSYEPAVCRVSF